EDRAGRLLIGTSEAGLFSFDGTNFTTVATSHQTILSLKEDREGNMWVGTRGGGLNQVRPRVAELMATGAGAALEAVRSVCQDTDGMLWAVVWQKGAVLRSAGQGWSPLSAEDGWNVNNAQCVAADPQGGVWIGTEYTGLYHWRNGAVTEYLCSTNGLSRHRVNALLPTASGDFWIGSGYPEDQQQALQRRRDGQFRTFNLPSGSGPVVALAMDAAGDCWAATAGGLLLRVRGDVLTDETENTLAGAGTIRCLLATPDGSLWIGTGGQGLGRLKDGRFSRCRMSQGLYDDYISNVLPDGLGRLWCAGNRGIFSVRQKELDDIAEGRVTRVRSVAYRQKDGLPGLQASFDGWPGAVRGADGRLLFAMQTGVAAVYADAIKENTDPPPVVIEGVNVNGKALAAHGALGVGASMDAGPSEQLELIVGDTHVRVPPGRRQVEFVFTALSFIKPEDIVFRYRLHGLEADWGEAGTRRSVTYTQLPPGHYRFEVTACNSDGVWSEKGAALDLTAEPYWWETAWFRVAGPISGFGLLGGWILLWLRRRHRHQIERLELLQATAQERARIARDLHDDIGAGLTEIAMQSHWVSRDIAPSAAPDTLRRIDRVCQSATELTRSVDEIVWAVNPANDTLERFVNYLSQAAVQFLNAPGLRVRFDIPAGLPAAVLSGKARHNLFLAVREALNNATKHARAEVVRIVVRVEDDELHLRVEDNGCGFAPENAGAAGTHEGLENMRRRMEELGGRFCLASRPGEGTKVEFIAPLQGQQTGRC
ncbi:MAG: two-component regulator propeller domain-containing protein, partial [bacterium]